MIFRDYIASTVRELFDQLTASVDASIGAMNDAELDLLLEFAAVPEFFINEIESDDFDLVARSKECLDWVSRDDVENMFGLLKLSYPLYRTVFEMIYVLSDGDIDEEIGDVPGDFKFILLDSADCEKYTVPMRRGSGPSGQVCPCYGFEDPVNEGNTIGYFNLDIEKWYVSIRNLSVETMPAPKIFYIAIKCICAAGDRFGRGPILVCHSSVCDQHAVSALRLHLLISGHQIHVDEVASLDPLYIYRKAIDLTKSYSQFNDAQIILSEYNSRSELLGQYISLYHVLENYMVRIRIAELISKGNGKMPSIRDFKRIGIVSEEGEKSLLRNFVKKIWSLDICGECVSDFSIRLGGEISSTLTPEEIDSLDSFLEKLCFLNKNGVAIKFSDVLSEYTDARVSDLIYLVRCAVIHNKETEFHISHNTIDRPCRILMERFLMPVMKRMAFGQMALPGSPIRYEYKNIELFA